ncbi:MAG TPA: hypothetical protein PLW55_15320, partial [Leptospiraceae bacterium]|nr:hypothetical protein [Leptospiraceae bacterium]
MASVLSCDCAESPFKCGRANQLHGHANIFLFIALAINLGTYWFSDKIALKMSGAQPMTEEQAPQIYEMVRELTTAAKMPMPRLYVIPQAQANAFATGRNPDNSAHHEENVDIGQALFYAYSAGELKPQQLRLMRNVLAFTDRTVREAMTPAREVIYLDLRRSWQENMAVADEHGFSRLPVVDGDPHNVVGYARRADLLQAELKG